MTNQMITADPEVSFAIDAIRQASLLVKQVQLDLVSSTLTKGDRSPVTVADYACQAVVAYRLGQAFPSDPLVAEEDSQALRLPQNGSLLEKVTAFVRHALPQADAYQVCQWIDHNRVDSADRFWTLDPIDGTKGFLRGEQYAVALALVVKGVVKIGVLGCPNLRAASQFDLHGPGSLVVAVRGQGAWTAPLGGEGGFEQLRVSDIWQPAQARLLRSFEAGHTNVDQMDVFAQVLGIQAAPVLMDSQAKYAVLAAGAGDLLLRLLSPAQPHYREKIWDQAAGSLVLQEAGGRISDLHGRDLDFAQGRELIHNRGILASNGLLHQAALQALVSMDA